MPSERQPRPRRPRSRAADVTGLHSLDGAPVATVPVELALCPLGVFTTFVVVDGGVLGLDDHLERLRHGCARLWGHALALPRVLEALRAHVALLSEPATVRVSLLPEEFAVATPVDAAGVRILISSRPVVFPFVVQSDFSVASVEHERALADVKSTELLTQMRLRREAQLAGHDDVLFRRGDEALEGATWTVLCWRDGEVATPGDAVLPSTTAKQLSVVAQRLGWTFRVRPVAFAELRSADLVQAASVNHPARAIGRLDGERLAPQRELLEQIAAAYAELTRTLVGDYDA